MLGLWYRTRGRTCVACNIEWALPSTNAIFHVSEGMQPAFMFLIDAAFPLTKHNALVTDSTQSHIFESACRAFFSLSA